MKNITNDLEALEALEEILADVPPSGVISDEVLDGIDELEAHCGELLDNETIGVLSFTPIRIFREFVEGGVPDTLTEIRDMTASRIKEARLTTGIRT